MDFHYSTCSICADYLERRRSVIVPEMVKQSDKTGESFGLIAHRYFTGVHDRHMAGLSLEMEATA